jgi:hypothetical protein
MIQVSPMSRQPSRKAWTPEALVQERAKLMGLAHDRSTIASYVSALNSFLTFCQLHNLPIEPTPEILSLYVAFQCAFISPASVSSYLSGICSELEPYISEIVSEILGFLLVLTSF